MIVIPAKSRATGFSVGVERQNSFDVFFTYDVDTFERVFDITVGASVISTGHVSSIIQLQSLRKSIAGGFLRASIDAYRISADAAIPENFDGLSCIWSTDRRFPYDSNLFMGKVDEIIDIPLVAGRYLLRVKINGHVVIPKQDETQHLIVFDRFDLSGVPASTETQYFETMVKQLGAVVESISSVSSNTASELAKMADLLARADTQIEKLNQIIAAEAGDDPIDYTTALANIKASLDSVVTGVEDVKSSVLSAKLDVLHEDLK